MLYRVLGSTGLRISAVGVGTWQFGGEWGHEYSQPEVDSIMRTAEEQGINFLDTAECYGDHLSEKFIGEALRQHRDKWIVATKFGHKYHGFQERTRHWSAREVREQLEESLRALKTDHIDLYQFHSGSDEEFDNDELWEMLRKQIESGKIGHLGISISGSKSEDSNLYQTESAPRVGAEVIQLVYNRLDRTPEQRVLPACRRLDLGVLARVPLASGFLSGKYRPGATFTGQDVRATRDRSENDGKLEEVARIREKEVPKGVDMASWALAWCLKNPAVTAVIPGCKNPDQVISNARAVEVVEDASHHPQAVAE